MEHQMQYIDEEDPRLDDENRSKDGWKDVGPNKKMMMDGKMLGQIKR